MQKTTVWLFLIALMTAGLALLGQEKKPPDKLTFDAKNGKVTFDHAAHVKSAKGDCKTCHDKLFPESASAPLNFKAGVHKPAEKAKTSCGSCHRPGGNAFESKGNCAKCHVKS
ncbi:MAG: hypothetical protein LAP38_19525 [Acidobacteriia bacterium]|nr:hypothetical protein [Terriglobia bacterium]